MLNLQKIDYAWVNSVDQKNTMEIHKKKDRRKEDFARKLIKPFFSNW